MHKAFHAENTKAFLLELFSASFSAFFRLSFALRLSRLNSRQPALESADLFFSFFPRFSLGLALGNRGFSIPSASRASFRALHLSSASRSTLQTMASDSSDDDMPIARTNGRCELSPVYILTFFLSLFLSFFQFPNSQYLFSAHARMRWRLRSRRSSMSNRAQVSIGN